MTATLLVRRTLATTIAATALAGVITAPASAAVVRPFDIYTSKTMTKGQAHVYGTATFLANGNVRITGKLNDVCPEDGYGAYVYFRSSNTGTMKNYGVRQDTRGCKESALPFSFTYRRQSYEGRINAVRILLKEYDQINPPVGPYKRGDENSFLVTRR